MKIYAPVKDFNGLRNGVRFVNGVGETDNPQAITWFKSHGYRVETVENSLEKGDEIIEKLLKKCDEPNFDAMTPNELREWAMKNGLGNKIRNTRNREKLLEIVRGD